MPAQVHNEHDQILLGEYFKLFRLPDQVTIASCL
jgi:hypothetical protein